MARHRTLRRAMASTSAKMPRRLCLLGLIDCSAETQTVLTRPLSAPGSLVRRFCGDASVHDMSVTLLRTHSRPNNMARHRTLRRELASASAKVPRRRWRDGVRCHGYSLCADSLCGGLLPQESCRALEVYLLKNLFATFFGPQKVDW
jgi:hypothetical protein